RWKNSASSPVLLHIGQWLLHCSPKRKRAMLRAVTGASSGMRFLNSRTGSARAVPAGSADSPDCMTSDRLNGASCDLWLGSGWLVVGRTAARRGRRVASLVARFGRAQAPVELRGDDLLHMLGNQTDDQVDEALLVAAIVVRPRSRLLVLEHAADLF